MFKKKDGTRAYGRIATLAIVVVVLAVAVLSSFVVIEAGHTGVVVTLGSVEDKVLQEGLHAKIPFAQQIIHMDNRQQLLEVSTQAFSKDLQTIEAKLAINYRVDKGASNAIYKDVGLGYEAVIIIPTVHEILKAVVAQYTASTLVSDRSAVSTMLDQGINEKLISSGIVVESINIIDWDFSEEYIKAIEQKQVAEQNLIKTRTEQEQAVVISEAEAKQKLIAAQATSEAAVIEAEARAKQITLEADAQAEANLKLAQSLSQDLIDYETINKWDGQLPQVQSGGTPLIGIDLDR